MSSVYTIYCYFNGEQIQRILNAVVMLMGSGGVDGNYLSLIRVGAILGLFIAVCYGFVRARGEDAGMYIIMVVLFYSTLFVPRVTVLIEDHGGVGIGAPVAVDNVPVGLAFFASTTSHIGYWLTETTETFFSLPDSSLRLGSHGLMGGPRAMRLAQSAAIPDPVLAQDMINFMRDCINPELISSPTLVSALLNSNEIWKDLGPSGLGVLNPGRMVSLAGSAMAVNCERAYTVELGPRLVPAATSEFARIAQMLSPHTSAATAQVMLTALLPAAESLIMTASASTTEAIRQRMMINLLNDTAGNLAQIMNDPSGAQIAVGSAMAASSANNAYAVMARLGQETLPIVRSSIELVILGIFPIVLILVIIAGSKGGAVLRSYMLTMFWVQLWAPLYAIVNYVGTMDGAKSMKAALSSVDGISVANAAQLMNTTISGEGIMGILTIAVPLLALAIVKGGEVAMAGVTSSLTSPAAQAASRVGGEVGQGNVSIGNSSWGNYTANNASANSSKTGLDYKTPNRADIQTEYGSMTYRGSEAGTSNAIGNGRPELGSPGIRGGHGSAAEAGSLASSGQRAELSSGTSSSLGHRTSGQFTQQEGASALAKIQKGLESSIGGDHSWMTRDGTGKSDTAGDRAVTTTGTSHTSTVGIGGRTGYQAGASTTASNPSHRAEEGHNTAAANEVLYGEMKQQPSGPAGALVGESKPPAPGSKPASLLEKAQELATRLGSSGVSRTSVGPVANYGLDTRELELKNWGSERNNSAERQLRAEKNFEKAAKAIEGLMAKSSSVGERSAMMSFLGALATSTDAAYQTNVGQNYTRTASVANNRSDTSGASFQVDDSARYFAEALRLAGGNGARALQELATNAQFRDQVAKNVGAQVAHDWVPGGSSIAGMDGSIIEAPKSVAQQRQEGVGAVEGQQSRDQAAAVAAGQRYLSDGESSRGYLGAPAGLDMPDQSSAQQLHENNVRGTDGGLASGRRNVSREAGVNRLLEAAFADQQGTGAARLVGSLLGGFGTRTHDENAAAMRKLADSDPKFAARLEQIGNRGRVDDEDIAFLRDNRSDGFFDRIGEGISQGIESVKDFYGVSK